MIDRKELLKEQLLRETIRKLIKKTRRERQKQNSLEEVTLRKVIRKTLLVEKTPVGDSPHQKTGINKLRQTLKVVVPTVRDDYLTLTTDKAQRDSYIAHLVNGIDNILAPAELNIDAPESSENNSVFKEMDTDRSSAGTLMNEMDEDINIDIGEEDQEEPLDLGIDILPGSEEAEESEEDIDDDESALTKGMEGQEHDETGRNAALSTFKQIQGTVVDDFSTLANDEDRELYHDYMKTNILLWRDKFEETLSTNLPDPTTPEYEKEKQNLETSPEEDSGGIMAEDLQRALKAVTDGDFSELTSAEFNALKASDRELYLLKYKIKELNDDFSKLNNEDRALFLYYLKKNILLLSDKFEEDLEDSGGIMAEQHINVIDL